MPADHHIRHAGVYIEGCYLCRLRSISISAEALPTRGKAVSAINAKQKRWDRDGDALKRLAKDGIVPRSIDGVAEMEARGETKYEIESGHHFNSAQRAEYNAVVGDTGLGTEAK
jgi:hypothetical protein